MTLPNGLVYLTHGGSLLPPWLRLVPPVQRYGAASPTQLCETFRTSSVGGVGGGHGPKGQKRRSSQEERFLATDATRRSEIVEEIVDWLRPWKHRMSDAAVTAAVNHHLDLLLLVPLDAKLFDRRQYRAHAERLDGALLKVETLLASAPGVLALALFDPVTITEDGVLMRLCRRRLTTSSAHFRNVQIPLPAN